MPRSSSTKALTLVQAAALAALVFLVTLRAAAVEAEVRTPAPFEIAPALFDRSLPDDLGLKPLPGTRTVTIFQPDDAGPHYNNGAVLMPFKGRLYAQWQSSPRDEDSPDTQVLTSWSDDGEHWSAPAPLVPGGFRSAWHSSGGWWTDGATLVAYVNVWPRDSRDGGHAEYLTSEDGVHWTSPQPVLDDNDRPVSGIIEQDPHALPDGRIITAFHLAPGLIATPYFTDDPQGIRGWTRGKMQNLAHASSQSRELEPSWFARRDGSIVMAFRDQDSSFRLLASESIDRGAHWNTPVLTAMPDSRSKQSAGNLPDGAAFLVNAPSGTSTRVPLVVTLSQDGRLFDRAYVLRSGGADLPPLRFPGKYKRTGYHYPKSVVWAGRLFVAYVTNKEDVQLTVVPLSSLTD